MATSAPSTASVGSIPRFFKHIQVAGIPPKVTNPYLKSVGFKSSNDYALIGILKALDFIDHGGVPTTRWNAYRDTKNAKFVLAEAIRNTYTGLFGTYPHAEGKDDEAVANWVRGNTSFSGVTVERAVRTFKTLCAEADFSAALATTGTQTSPSVPNSVTASTTAAVPVLATQGNPSVNINIELHLPSTNDPEVYDNFFKSMKAHLFSEKE